MSSDIKLISVTKKNLDKYPARCFMSPDHIGYKNKKKWLIKRFDEGLRIKQLYDEKDKLLGFVEYVPGKCAWRAVNAKGYLFIHCIWVSPKKIRNQGFATRLIQEVIQDAKKDNMMGVAVIVSSGPFMAEKDVFLKNNFKVVEEDEPFSLLTVDFKKGKQPSFRDWKKQLQKYKGLHIVYANQCPWVARSIEEIKPIIKKKKLDITITELKTPKDAQNAPSIYAVYNLIHDGKLLADHYISKRRFENILKELKL